MPSVALDSVSKIYPGGVTAVEALSLEVHDGELMVLVGPSGCGKTTTLRLIAGLEEPTSGQVRLGERVVNKVAPHERSAAMVFQRPALYPHRTVRGNLGFSLAMKQGSLTEGGRERVAATARLLGLEALLDRYPSQLSGGEQQRVALGRALVRQPDVLLLDEPLSNLDAGLRLELRRQLHLLQRRLEATMIYVTHDPVEALSLGDRVAVLNRGRLQQVDRPDDVFQRPANRFVAGFIGWPAMNFVDGELQVEGVQLVFVADAGRLTVPSKLAEAWRPWIRHPLTLGIRPEDLAVGVRTENGAWPMQVRLIESLGHGRLVTVASAAGACEMTVWMRGGCQMSREMDIMTREKSVMVHIELEKCCLFDRASGAALAVRATG
jgi:multiple sugar transport system ATP-binding protein